MVEESEAPSAEYSRVLSESTGFEAEFAVQ